jgi:hypothetical protein
MSKIHIHIAERFLKDKFPKADSAFVSGSLVRGEGSEHSDLDIVILFPKIPNAFRESFIYESMPIEAFIHDPETIHWFVDDEKKSGGAYLAHMMSTGRIIPKPTVLSKEMLSYVNSVLKNGPDAISKESLLKLRYSITDLVDDLRDDRPQQEKIACAVKLYPLLAEAVLRNSGRWLAHGKWIPRELKVADAKIAKKFDVAFNAVFAEQRTNNLIRVSEEILEPLGGLYWEGWRTEAPKKWKKKFNI